MNDEDAMELEISYLASVLNSVGAPVASRISAAHRLSRSDEPDALEALLLVGQDEHAPSLVSRAAGEGLAKILWRLNQIDSVNLAMLSSEAYLGFDNEVARLLKSAR